MTDIKATLGTARSLASSVSKGVPIPIQGPPGEQGEQGEQGIPGPAGPTSISGDPGNGARLGSDNLIYFPLTVSPTPPPNPAVNDLWIDTTT